VIGKAKSGAGFGGLTRYLLTGKKDDPRPDRVLWTSTRELALEDPREAAVLMRATASLGRTDKPVEHFSISFAPGEHLTREQWERVIDTTLRDLDLEGHQALIVAHRDTAHEHIHLMVNRVHPETFRAWDRWQDRPRLMASLRPQEIALGLQPTPHVKNPDRLPDGMVKQFERTGELPLLDYARGSRQIFREAQSWSELHEQLAAEGLYLERKGQGLVVTDDHRHVKASSVDRSASLKALEARLGPYQERSLRLREVDSDLRGDRHAELYAQLQPAFRARGEAERALATAQGAARRVQTARSSISHAIAEAFRNPAHVESRYLAALDQKKAPPDLPPAQLGELKGWVLHAGRTSIPIGNQGTRAFQIAGQLPRLANDYRYAQGELARAEQRYTQARKVEAQLRERFRPQFAELEQIQNRSTTLYDRMLSLRPRDQIALARSHGSYELERAAQRRPEAALRTVSSRERWLSQNLSPELSRVLDRRLRRIGLSRPGSGESLTTWAARALHRGLNPMHAVQMLTRGGVALADAANTVSRAYDTIRHPVSTARRYSFRTFQKLTGVPLADIANAASLATGAIRSPAKTALRLTAKSLGLPSLPVRLATMAWGLVRDHVLSR
jgi:hypothetical protein